MVSNKDKSNILSILGNYAQHSRTGVITKHFMQTGERTLMNDLKEKAAMDH